MLNLPQLVDVYEESIYRQAREDHPDLSTQEGFFQSRDDLYNYLQYVFFTDQNAKYFLWEMNKQYVCALRVESYLDGLLVQAVETHPQHRRKGYAKQLLCAAKAQLFKDGFACLYSHVEKTNGASLALHLCCGFTILKENARLADGSVSNRYYTLQYNKMDSALGNTTQGSNA